MISNHKTNENNTSCQEIFSKILSTPSDISEQAKVLSAAWLDTALGSMLAIADEESLYLLEFFDCKDLKREVERLREKAGAAILPGTTAPIQSIKTELEQYFSGESDTFSTPFTMLGTDFQVRVWRELMRIPRGETRSYGELAKAIGNPTGFRAVARANGMNQLAIVIPCHRVINANGELGGYAGGVKRKQWLLNHER